MNRAARMLWRAAAAVGACAIAVGSGMGCERQPAPPTPPVAFAPAVVRFPKPVTAVMPQRSTVELPETNPAMVVAIDDITRGQVAVTVRSVDGRVLAGPQSLQVNDRLEFELEKEPLALTVTKLDNALIGNDHATIAIAPRGTTLTTISGATDTAPPAANANDAKSATPGVTDATSNITGASNAAVDQRARIERLIADLASTSGIVYIRNDGEHSPSEAAAHLRTKWSAAGSRITTAEEFIEHCGTRSSMSGEPYRVRFADGREMASRDYLLGRLRALDGADTSSSP